MEYHPPLEDSKLIDGLRVGYLKFFGFWKIINDNRRTGKRNKLIKFQFYMQLIICIPYIVFQLTCFYFIEMDIQKATIINMYSLPAIIMWCRIMVFWIRLNTQCKLYNLVLKDFIHIPEHKKAKASSLYRKITKNANTLCLMAFIIDFSVVVTNIGIPGISVDYILYHKGSMFDVTTGRKKILSGWYPLQMDESPYYEIIFGYEVICLTLAGIFHPTYVCLFYQVLVALYAQFVVLGYHASTMNVRSNNLVASDPNPIDRIKTDGNIDPRNQMSKEYKDSEISKDLYRIIQDHHKLLSYAKQLRSVYNPFITINLGLAMLFLTVSVFQYLLGITGDLLFLFKALQFLAAQMVELCMFCYGSSSLQEASSDIQLAVYNSDWYKADVKFRKSAQLLMMGAKDGVTLTAVKMYPVNKETLMAILQYVYSTSALMSGMLEK